MIRIEARSPGECDAKMLDAFESLVREGGEVAEAGLRGRIAAAHELVFAHDGNALIGVGALKRPPPDYRDRVFKKAGQEGAGASFGHEVGWIIVVPERRDKGVGRRITCSCVSGAGERPVFATSSTANGRMHRLLEELGFSRFGRTYKSDLDDDVLVLYTKEGA